MSDDKSLEAPPAVKGPVVETGTHQPPMAQASKGKHVVYTDHETEFRVGNVHITSSGAEVGVQQLKDIYAAAAVNGVRIFVKDA